MKKIIKIVLIVAVAALLVAAAVRVLKARQAEEAKLPPAKTYAVVVSVMRPKLSKVTLTLPALAQVQNDNDVVVASRLAARVEAIHQVGAKVKKGEAVVRLDTRDLEARASALRARIAAARSELAAAKTSLSALEAKHARTEKLMKVKGASREEFDAEVSQIAQAKAKIAGARSQIASLQASLREVAQQLDYAIIAAPVSGTVGRTFLNPGDMAMPGKPILSISAKAGDYLLVRLPADVKASSLLFGQERWKLYPLEHTFNGLSEYRTRRLNRGLETGRRVEVSAVIYEGEGLLLPVDAVLDKGGQKVALVVENGRAEAVPLRVVASGEEGVVVATKELAGRPVVVAKPDILLRLLGGTPVKVSQSGTKEP